LTVCLALIGPPAASLDNHDQPIGYNAAFAAELASRLDLESVIQQTDFSELTSNIAAHTCDVSVSSQNITAERTAQMNLIPYTQSKLGFPVVVASGNPFDVASLTDLCGKRVSAATGTTNVDAVNGAGDYQGAGINLSCAQAGAPPLDLHLFPTELDAVQALIDGSVIAYLGNANYVAQYPKLLQGTTAMLPPARQGIAVALDHPQLTAAMGAALSGMITDGTYLQILRQYVPKQSDVDNISIIE
jgi:ABC-type amino acid transport substrate-binding protein